MYNLQQGEPVFSVQDIDTGKSVNASPAVEPEADVSLDRLSLIKAIEKGELLPIRNGRSHRTEIGDDYVVISFDLINGRKIAKCHFYPKKLGAQKDGDLFKITVIDGKQTIERIRIA